MAKDDDLMAFNQLGLAQRLSAPILFDVYV
jgi:hypothetical protein